MPPDISMCDGVIGRKLPNGEAVIFPVGPCPIRGDCYRYTAIPDEDQVFGDFEYNWDICGCEWFYP